MHSLFTYTLYELSSPNLNQILDARTTLRSKLNGGTLWARSASYKDSSGSIVLLLLVSDPNSRNGQSIKIVLYMKLKKLKRWQHCWAWEYGFHAQIAWIHISHAELGPQRRPSWRYPWPDDNRWDQSLPIDNCCRHKLCSIRRRRRQGQ